MTGNPFEPFTADDLRRAVQLVMTDDEAERTQQSLSSSFSGPMPTIDGRNIGRSWFSDDLLLLMAVESEELGRKVETFRRDELGITDPAEDGEWQRRLAELKKWLETTDRVG